METPVTNTQTTGQTIVPPTTPNSPPPSQQQQVVPGEVDVTKLQEQIKSLTTELSTMKAHNSRLEEGHNKFTSALKAAGIITENTETPEDQIKSLTAAYETLTAQNAILQQGISFGIGSENMEYFEFIVNKKINSLQEGQEFGEEDWKNAAQEVKRFQSPGGISLGTTSVGLAGVPNPNQPNPISLEQFRKMNLGEKQALYNKDASLFERLTVADKTTKRFA